MFFSGAHISTFSGAHVSRTSSRRITSHSGCECVTHTRQSPRYETPSPVSRVGVQASPRQSSGGHLAADLVAQTIPTLPHFYHGALRCCYQMWSLLLGSRFLARNPTLMMMIISALPQIECYCFRFCLCTCLFFLSVFCFDHDCSLIVL